jgi:amidohydrolase
MDDEKDVPYRSQVPGVSHACGHDVHTAIVLGTALYLAHHRDEVSGRVRFLFQPAEERVPGGALDVLADGGLDGVGAVVGLHCDPKLPVGQVGVRVGSITSAADMARISLRGPGGHTARPEQTVDMVTLAARVIAELPTRVGEAIGAADQVKVVFGAVHAGDAANVIPAHAELRASVRTPSLDVWERLPGTVAEAVTELLGGTGAEFELDYTHGVPPVVNHVGMTDVVRRSLASELGDAAITEAIQSWGGDDFAWYTREVPGTFVRLGVHDPASDVPPLDLHAGRFDADERSIAIGVRVAVRATRDLLAAGAFDGV